MAFFPVKWVHDARHCHSSHKMLDQSENWAARIRHSLALYGHDQRDTAPDLGSPNCVGARAG